MKTIILIATIASILFSPNILDSQMSQAQTADKPPAINTSSTAGNSPNRVAQATAVQTQLSVASSPPAQSLPIIAPPADIASLTAKEILAANNQVVNHLASMYQNFGLLITIIVTFAGIILTALGYMAKKSVSEFIQEWTIKMKSLESEMKNALNRLHDAVSEAESSATRAAKDARSIGDNKAILDRNLQEFDVLKARIASFNAQIDEKREDMSPSLTEEGVLPPPPQTPATEDDAEVSARLQGKINSIDCKG